jgi:hypothetical protein
MLILRKLALLLVLPPLIFPAALLLTVCTIVGLVSAYDLVTRFVAEHYMFRLDDREMELTGVLGFILYLFFVVALIAAVCCVICLPSGEDPRAYDRLVRLEEKTRVNKSLLCPSDSDDDDAYKEMP